MNKFSKPGAVSSSCPVFNFVLIHAPEQSLLKVIDNILYCLQAGTRLGWLLAPDDRSILAFLPRQEPVMLTGDHRLLVLPGIPLDLTAHTVFDWLKLNG